MLSLKSLPLRTAPPFAAPPDCRAGLPARAATAAALPRGTPLSIARDGAIFSEGEPAVAWYRLLRGTVRVFRFLPDGRRHIGEFVHPGDIFGFEAGPAHLQSAEAIEHSECLAYSIAAIEQRIAIDPEARRAIRGLLVDRLAAAQNRILTLGRLTAGERLADFLLAMARRSACGRVAELPMSRVDAADYLGLTVETLSRLFTALRRRGIIRLPTAYHVEIVDLASLEAASGGAQGGAYAAGAPRSLS